jgi:hypothetical protein
MFGWTLVSQELTGGNIRFMNVLRRQSWWIISVSTGNSHRGLSSIRWLDHTIDSRSNIDSRPILVSHVISFPSLLVILLLSIVPVIADKYIIVVYSLLQLIVVDEFIELIFLKLIYIDTYFADILSGLLLGWVVHILISIVGQMIYGLVIIVKLAAIWILILTHVLIVHRILRRNHILSSKSWVYLSIRRLELLHSLGMSILLVHLLLLIMRRLVWCSWVRHLHRWDSWYLSWWLLGHHTSWAPHLAYMIRMLLIRIHQGFWCALTWLKHGSTFGISWRNNLLLVNTLWGAHVVSMLHWNWHGHFSLSFCLGLWFDTIAAF